MKSQENKFFSLFLFILLLILIALTAPASAGSNIVTGTIAINTVPTGATIYLDGVLIGKKSNGFIPDVSIGIHSIKLTLPGYRDCEKFVEVSSNEIAGVEHEFIKAENTFRILSDPKGADVYINGEYRGKTDTMFTLQEGQQYKIRLTLDGYFPYETTVNLQEKISEGIHHDFVALPTVSSIKLYSIPERADVYLDGNYSGKSNMIIENVRPGTHTIRLSKYGFDDLETPVFITVEKTEEVHLTLRPQDGILFIDSIPVKGTVYVDGSNAGEAPHIKKYNQGRHRVEVRSDAFETSSRDIDLSFEGQSLLIELTPLAVSEISSSEIKITKNEKYNPVNAMEVLIQSKQQLENGEYKNAYESAKYAGRLAEDVDEDYIPNWLDIQPNVKNTYLYIVPFILLLAICGLILYDRCKCQVVATLEAGVDEASADRDTTAHVNLSIGNEYLSMVCTVYLDNGAIDSLVNTGEHRVNLGPLPAGKHILTVKLSIQKKRYGQTVITKTVEFEVR